MADAAAAGFAAGLGGDDGLAVTTGELAGLAGAGELSSCAVAGVGATVAGGDGGGTVGCAGAGLEHPAASSTIVTPTSAQDSDRCTTSPPIIHPG